MKTKPLEFACGHSGEISVTGSYEAVRRQIERAGTARCPQCIISADTDSGLPALNGTDRQIAWAISIRQKALERLSEFERKALPDAIAAEAMRQLSAQWWIENRGYLTGTLADFVQPFFKANQYVIREAGRKE
ncbi:MAG: hypothetical protein KA368_10405 [Acidobacteria bacterium]|nr:hypothetical protein [Acidobacteriota bacterium]